MRGKAAIEAILPLVDALMIAPVAGAALTLASGSGASACIASRGRGAVLYRLGIFPIRRDYYEPAFHPADLPKDPVKPNGPCRAST